MNDMTAAGLARVISHACRMAHEDRLSRPYRAQRAIIAPVSNGRFYVRLAGQQRFLARISNGPLCWSCDPSRAVRFPTRAAALDAVADLDGEFIVETVQ